MLIFAKAMYFFGIIDAISPLFDLIIKILYDIQSFMIIMFLYILAGAMCFYFVAANQIEFDCLSEDETKQLNYRTFSGAVGYMIDLVFGELDTEGFSLGKDPS